MIFIFKDINGIVVGVAHKSVSETDEDVCRRFCDRKFGLPTKKGEKSFQRDGDRLYASERPWMPNRIITVEKFEDSETIFL